MSEKQRSSSRVTLIVAGTPVAALAAKQATTSIPIVFHIGSDPVKDGLVASLNRPGGNVTGTTFFSNLLTSKLLGLLTEMIPSARIIAVVVNRTLTRSSSPTKLKKRREPWVYKCFFFKAATQDEINTAFEDLRQHKPDALLVLGDAFLYTRAAQIAYSALRSALPTCFAYREAAL
jgi:putative ABC transport system substrate-binding protein